jgi:hypothetical protein
MKNKIVVAEATSTAFNYLEDIRALGFEPVILEAYLPDGYARRTLDEERKVKYSHIKYPITILKEDPDYEVTLREVRALDPLLVIPGGEEGVVIGTRLADDLGMTGNPYSNIANMTQKSAMHESLKKAGLRYIRGTEVKTWEDCLAFLEETGTEDVVLKHDHGAASVGVHLVHGREELRAAFEQDTASTTTCSVSQKPISCCRSGFSAPSISSIPSAATESRRLLLCSSIIKSARRPEPSSTAGASPSMTRMRWKRH